MTEPSSINFTVRSDETKRTIRLDLNPDVQTREFDLDATEYYHKKTRVLVPLQATVTVTRTQTFIKISGYQRRVDGSVGLAHLDTEWYRNENGSQLTSYGRKHLSEAPAWVQDIVTTLTA